MYVNLGIVSYKIKICLKYPTNMYIGINNIQASEKEKSLAFECECITNRFLVSCFDLEVIKITHSYYS